jgi:transposase
MMPLPAGTKIWLVLGRTDMRRGMAGLALQVQETLTRDPNCGHVFIFRGRRGDLIKAIWHDGQGGCLFAKRLEKGLRFQWPTAKEGAAEITPAQTAMLLEALDWRAPRPTFRPAAAG